MNVWQSSIVTHYAKTSMGDALCAMDYPRTHGITAWKTDTTCPRCLGLLGEQGQGDDHKTDAERPPASIRTGVKHAEADLRNVVINLSIWEGRGDWAAWDAEARQQSAARALDLLDDVIESLADWRDALSTALLSTALGASAPSPVDDTDDGGRGSVGPTHMYAEPDYAHARCGGTTGGASMIWVDVTCPQCLALRPARPAGHQAGRADRDPFQSPAMVVHSLTTDTDVPSRCGVTTGGGSFQRSRVTCLTCLALLAGQVDTAVAPGT